MAAENIFLKYSVIQESADVDQQVSLKMVNCFLFDAVIANRMADALLQKQDADRFCQAKGLCALQFGLLLWKHAAKLGNSAL